MYFELEYCFWLDLRAEMESKHTEFQYCLSSHFPDANGQLDANNLTHLYSNQLRPWRTPDTPFGTSTLAYLDSGSQTLNLINR
jgi:hypothetical protein